jgi:hypothetical protein
MKVFIIALILTIVVLHLLDRNGFNDFDHASPAAIEQFNNR